MKLKDLQIGQQFKLHGNTYTKLNEEGYCLLDEYCKAVPRWAKYCAFNPVEISNNFDKSLIKEYINSEFFKTGILRLDDVEVTLLSCEEVEEYKFQIKPFFAWSWLRSGHDYSFISCTLFDAIPACGIDNVRSSYAVRPALRLNLDLDIEKCRCFGGADERGLF